jgi:2-polyprenyl-6-methoxyphenol hydroxylase-like FAD-dependent oxidoreductase
MDPTEVLVVGAGPVGMFSALLLAQNGIRTRIIDQESRTAGHSYSCALHPRSIELLHQVGLASDATEFGRRIDSVAFYEGSERRAEVKFSELPVKYPFVLVLEQSTLENMLEQRLRRTEVRINWNHRLSGLDMNDQGVTASIEKLGMIGKGYGVPDFEQGVKDNAQTRASFLIGADGSNSSVRSRLGLRFEHTSAPQHFAVYEAEVAEGCGNEARVVLHNTSSNAFWPLADTRCRWSFQMNPAAEGDDFPSKERDRLVVVQPSGQNDNLHQLGGLLQNRAPWFHNRPQEVVWATDVQFEPRLARQFGRNLCWLVGDAAHQTGPIGMQSMNIGLREAADLVGRLTQILRKGGSAELLRSYDRAHWSEWSHLLGVKTGSLRTEGASEWVRQRADRIVGSIPASGDDLSNLLRQVGIHFQPTSSQNARAA